MQCFFLDWAEPWLINPTGPGPEPCWTPNQKFGLNGLRCSPKSEFVCFFPSISYSLNSEESLVKRCDVKSQNSFYSNIIAKMFCTIIEVLLLRAMCVSRSLPGSNTGVVQDTSLNRVLRKKKMTGWNTPWWKTSSGLSAFFQYQNKYTRHLLGVDICAAAWNWSHYIWMWSCVTAQCLLNGDRLPAQSPSTLESSDQWQWDG